MKFQRCLLMSLLTICALFAIAGTAAAQVSCPTPLWSPSTPYTNGGCYNTSMTINLPAGGTKTCAVRICYCYRTIGTQEDYYITRVQISPAGCYGATISMNDIINAASKQIIQDNPRGLPCTGTAEYNWTVTKESCWHAVSDPFYPDDEIYEPCGAGTGYCRDLWRVTCNPRTVTLVRTDTFHSSCPNGCNPLCND